MSTDILFYSDISQLESEKNSYLANLQPARRMSGSFF